MPQWVTDGYQEYARRLPRDCSLQLTEIVPAKRGKTGHAEQWKQDEGKRLLSALSEQDHVVALAVEGKPWSTPALAAELAAWQQRGQDVSFLVGGPDGLSAECMARANQLWSLSALTMPHPLVRVIMAEQIYRAWSLLNNHPYHRA
ncbi:LSU m3Psi1915 methyltransferase RlmH / ybeA [Methylophaga frappieri]|uniref:Ribosomal RNA large subunit methyltransferase H n=2 Tax=Methylophaga frappieri (strain ATCC BAA-2434 / DSM 25690 / JAM7) TaxID=754477 RepID=I1YFS1_METFJ|nr:LSU m3Psi1915 methyltransferase RlmH / ybeA [Methylophaga frappieri]